MADYATAAQVGYFAHEFAALDPVGQALLVTAASRIFDKQVEVAEDFFAPAPDPVAYSTRDFFGDGTAWLKLDPYTALNPVDPITITGDYEYQVPEYTEVDGALVVLERTMQMHPDAATYPHRFTGWRDGVKVTVSANWGFSETPKDVVMAVIHIALHIWRTADPAFAQISNAEGTASRAVTLPQLAQDVVEKYRQKYTRRFVMA